MATGFNQENDCEGINGTLSSTAYKETTLKPSVLFSEAEKQSVWERKAAVNIAMKGL